MHSEDDIRRFYNQIKANSCTASSTPENQGTDAEKTTDSIRTVIENGPVRPPLRCWKYSHISIFAEHVFVALDKTSCFHKSRTIYNPIYVRPTWYHNLKFSHLMLEYKRYHLLPSIIYSNHWTLRLLGFPGLNISNICTLLDAVIERNDSKACQILLPALLAAKDTHHINNHYKLISWLRSILTNNAFDVLVLLVPFFKTHTRAFERNEELLPFVREVFQNKTMLEVLLRNDILQLVICLCEAVKEGMLCKRSFNWYLRLCKERE